MRQANYIRKMKNGDVDAADAFIEELYPQVYAFVYRTLCGKEDAKDITQEVFLRFMNALDLYEERQKPLSYLFKIAMHLCYDYFRKQQTQREQNAYEQVIPPQPTPHEVSMHHAQQAGILRALQTLPYEQRETVVLRYYHQLKFREIAKLMDVSESTVKSRNQQALMKLRKLQEEGSL